MLPPVEVPIVVNVPHLPQDNVILVTLGGDHTLVIKPAQIGKFGCELYRTDGITPPGCYLVVSSSCIRNSDHRTYTKIGPATQSLSDVCTNRIVTTGTGPLPDP